MSVIHADVLKDPFVFNSDRNNWMSGGGIHTWNSSYEWTFTTPIYINWLAGRSTGSASRRGTANFNQINATTVTLAVDTCAYVVLDPNTDTTTEDFRQDLEIKVTKVSMGALTKK